MGAHEKNGRAWLWPSLRSRAQARWYLSDHTIRARREERVSAVLHVQAALQIILFQGETQALSDQSNVVPSDPILAIPLTRRSLKSSW